MKFVEMLQAVRSGMEIDQQTMAKGIGCSAQHLCDLEKGRRLPSVRIVESICAWLGRGPKGRREWHAAAARAHGWDV